jgi:hypothetical protein
VFSRRLFDFLSPNIRLFPTEGTNCGFSVVFSTAADFITAKVYEAASPTYVGNVLHIEAEKSPAPDFYHLLALADSEEVECLSH